jgi:hypothetical protein
VTYFDILNTIEIEGYMMDRNTDQIDFNQDVLVRLTYIDDAVLITTSD